MSKRSNLCETFWRNLNHLLLCSFTCTVCLFLEGLESHVDRISLCGLLLVRGCFLFSRGGGRRRLVCTTLCSLFRCGHLSSGTIARKFNESRYRKKLEFSLEVDIWALPTFALAAFSSETFLASAKAASRASAIAFAFTNAAALSAAAFSALAAAAASVLALKAKSTGAQKK